MKLLVSLSIGVLMGTCSIASSQAFTDIQRMSDGSVSLSWEANALDTYQLQSSEVAPGPYVPYTGRLARTASPYLVKPDSAERAEFFRLSVLDPDAAAYVKRAGVTDPAAIEALSLWVTGLKQLKLFEHVVYMASLQQAYNAGSGSIVHALKGPWGEIQGTDAVGPRWGSSGIEFNANGWVSLPNPFAPGFLSEFSLLAVFDSDQSAIRLILGSESSLQGPSLLAGGSATQGPNHRELFFDYSEDGVTPPSNFGRGGRRTFVGGNTGDPEMALATFGTNAVTCQVNMDLRFQDQGSFRPIWNLNPTWRIGARLDKLFPFVGTISFVSAFDIPLSDGEYDQVRQLYRNTLGKTIALPKINVLIEGDSMSEESLITTWGEELFKQPNWKGKFNKRNVAHGGDGMFEILSQYEAQVLPYANQPGKNYLFIWAGAREIQDRSGELTFIDLQRFWRMAREAGYTIVAFTILPNGESTPQVPPRRQKLNELIRASAADYDVLIDIDQHPLLHDPLDTTYYLPDRVHLRHEGHILVAEWINQMIPNP